MAGETPRRQTMTIDGREVRFEPGQTVIQVAHAYGVHVPHYCYHPGLSIAGNCRICMVEVEGSPRPQISCKMPAAEGLVVRTDSEIAKQGQAATMEMLLLNHPLDCPICDQAGECHLQEYSYQFGWGESRSTTPKTHLPKNVPFGSKIVYDAERCIKCTLCVRFCEEVTETDDLAMGFRSDNEIVIMETPEFGTRYSMNIVDICPVGALTSRDFRFRSRLWFMDFAPSLCTGCARGCNVTVGARDGRFLRMEPRENPEVNRWWMCDPGRLGYGHVNSETRLATPAVRDEAGVWRDATWENALLAAAEALRGVLAGREGGDVLVDGGATLEEMLVARHLAGVLGGEARFAAARVEGDGDDFLIVDEKGANARGAEALGLARQTEAAPAAVLLVERDEHVPAAMRDASGAVVVLTTDATHLPESARVAFPLGSWAERDGLLMNVDGVVQGMHACPAVGPGNLTPAFEVLEELCFELEAEYEWRGRTGWVEALRAEPGLAKATIPGPAEPAPAGAGR